MPAFVGFVSVILTLVFFPDEPIGWCIANDRIEDAKRSILSVYTVKAKQDKDADVVSMNDCTNLLIDELVTLRRSTTSMD